MGTAAAKSSANATATDAITTTTTTNSTTAKSSPNSTTESSPNATGRSTPTGTGCALPPGPPSRVGNNETTVIHLPLHFPSPSTNATQPPSHLGQTNSAGIRERL